MIGISGLFKILLTPLLLVSSPSFEDVHLPKMADAEGDEYGDVSFTIVYESDHNSIWPVPSTRRSVSYQEIEWSTESQPIGLNIVRNANGTSINFGTRFNDRFRQAACSKKIELNKKEQKRFKTFWSKLNSELDDWLETCEYIKVFDADYLKSAFAKQRDNTRLAFMEFSKRPKLEFKKDAQSNGVRPGFSPPENIKGAALIAISRACGGDDSDIILDKEGQINIISDTDILSESPFVLTTYGCQWEQVRFWPGFVEKKISNAQKN